MKRRTWALVIALAATCGAWLAWPRDGGGAASGVPQTPRPAEPPRPSTPHVRTPTADDAAPAAPVESKPAPRDMDAVIATLDGRVVDAVTGKPVAHAALKWGYVDPTKEDLQKNLWGETTGDGALKFVYPRNGYWAPERADDVAELWVSAKGYAIVKIRAPVAPVEVRLDPVPDRPAGSIRVRALRGDGVPWTGLVCVEAADAFGDAETLCGIADPDGRVTLLAVPVRFTRVRIDDERMPWTGVVVPPDGSVDIDLRGPAAGPFAEMTQETVVEKRDAAAKEMDSAKAKGDAARATEAEATWKAAWDELLHRASEQVPLVIANLPADAAPLVELRAGTKRGIPIVWRLPVADHAVTLSASRILVSPGRVSVTLPGGVVESRFITLVPSKDGSYETLPGDEVKQSFPLRRDGTLVLDWERLVRAKN